MNPLRKLAYHLGLYRARPGDGIWEANEREVQVRMDALFPPPYTTPLECCGCECPDAGSVICDPLKSGLPHPLCEPTDEFREMSATREGT